MKIEIRKRAIKNGCQSLYLDFYDEGKRWYEYLNLHLVPEKDAVSKKQNEDALAKAVEIKAKRLLGIEDEVEETTNEDAPKRVFADWLNAYHQRMMDNPNYSLSYCQNIKTFINVVKAYLSYKHRPRMLMKKIDKNFLLGFFGYIKNTYMNTKSPDNPQPLSPRSLMLIQTTITRVLNDAVKEGVLIANPFYSLSPHEKIADIQAQREFLTREEVQSMAVAPTINEQVRQAFMFCCFTGLRYSDVSSLTWGNIKQTSLGMVISLKAMQKTKRMLTVPLNKSAISWMPERNKQPLSQRVFDGLVTVGQCDRVLKRLAKEAGVNKVVSFHTSRHTFATNALAAGGDLYTVSKLLGHQSIRTTQVYADVVMDTKIEAVNLLNGLFNSR